MIENQKIIESFVPRSLRKLVLFESFHETYLNPNSQPIYYWSIRLSTPSASQKLARASLQLETLSACFITDASYFFKACQPAWQWQRLTSLTLTSRHLVPDASDADVNEMLLDAATAALSMPKLVTMEIWNGLEGLAALFRYQADRKMRSAEVTLRGTFEMDLSGPVAQAWEKVAIEHGLDRVSFSRVKIDGEVIGFHGDAIGHLGLINQVMRPDSLRQIVREHRSRTDFAYYY